MHHRFGTAVTCCLAAQQALAFSAEGTELWDSMPKVGGFLSMTVLPAHVSAPANLDRAAWMLLTLPAHLDLSVKAFKARLQSPLSVRVAALHDVLLQGLLSLMDALVHIFRRTIMG